MFLILSLAALGAGCSSRRIGWGLVLWTVKGTGAKAGTLVPVYLKSNITKNYVIGLEEDPKARVEVPLWQVEFYPSKRAALRHAEEIKPLASIYLIAGRDGLPVRAQPSNKAERVYRLRDKEMVKALAVVEGEALYTGNERLPGNWYFVLAMDGSLGYVFSYTMRLFDERTGEYPTFEKPQTDPGLLESFFSSTWRPSWYSDMVAEDRIDLDYFALGFGLFGDAKERQVRVETPGISKVFSYAGISQDGQWLRFEGTPLRIRLEDATSLIAAWGEVPAGGLPEDAGFKASDTSARFVVFKEDIRDLIRQEEARRTGALRNFFSTIQAQNPEFLDSAAVFRCQTLEGSAFSMWPSGLYEWLDTSVLPAGFPPDDAKEEEQRGRVVFGLILSPALAARWTGAFSLYSEASGRRSDYAYRIGSEGFAMARISASGTGSLAEKLESRLGTIIFSRR
ncbi:MAG: putative lipoprotein [Spirochaetes bacterium]|nr:MAG: putative lipoprotein [Spirochaetota bacterium]